MTRFGSDGPAPSLVAVIHHRAATTPDQVFLRDVDGDSASYAGTAERLGRWSAALGALGVAPGDRVVTMVPNSVEGVALWLGVAASGAIEVPVHPSFRGALLEHAVNSVEARLVVTTAAALPCFAEVLANAASVECVVVVDGGAPPGGAPSGVTFVSARDVLGTGAPGTGAPRTGAPGTGATASGGVGPGSVPEFHDPAVILFTSGTTGPSKPVIVSWGQLQVTAQGTFVYDDLDETDVFYAYSPPSHIGTKTWVYLAALVGGGVVLRPAFRTGEFLTDVRRFGITSAGLVGAMAHFLMGSPERPDDADIPLRNVVMAPLLPDPAPFCRRFGVRLYTAFGMTELSIPIRGDGWSTENPAAAGKVWSGWPFFEARLVDEADREVPAGDTGELIVRSGVPWTITPGYFGQPAATAEAWRNGWFHTGDLFRSDGDGWFYFVDRQKDCIRRRGENISSFEVEAAALLHPDVAEAAALAYPSDTNEDEIRLFLVAASGRPVEPAAVVAHLEEHLPGFMVPRFVEVLPELPKTPTLRTQKHELRRRPLAPNVWDREASAPGGGQRRQRR